MNILVWDVLAQTKSWNDGYISLDKCFWGKKNGNKIFSQNTILYQIDKIVLGLLMLWQWPEAHLSMLTAPTPTP